MHQLDMRELPPIGPFDLVAARGRHWDGSQDDAVDDWLHVKAVYLARRRSRPL